MEQVDLWGHARARLVGLGCAAGLAVDDDAVLGQHVQALDQVLGAEVVARRAHDLVERPGAVEQRQHVTRELAERVALQRERAPLGDDVEGLVTALVRRVDPQ